MREPAWRSIQADSIAAEELVEQEILQALGIFQPCRQGHHPAQPLRIKAEVAAVVFADQRNHAVDHGQLHIAAKAGVHFDQLFLAAPLVGSPATETVLGHARPHADDLEDTIGAASAPVLESDVGAGDVVGRGIFGGAGGGVFLGGSLFGGLALLAAAIHRRHEVLLRRSLGHGRGIAHRRAGRGGTRRLGSPRRRRGWAARCGLGRRLFRLDFPGRLRRWLGWLRLSHRHGCGRPHESHLQGRIRPARIVQGRRRLVELGADEQEQQRMHQHGRTQPQRGSAPGTGQAL
ncbi:hypothetical protein Hsero_2013 [Herbaspirillum seropedicae SmR1]|uniref:Uncharacterized protein n=1 Tax=Herbaspirillum seropedicae (strain SmR1) TaxID=757424 RepID=D8ISH0_HERSS|nr:hypothetical protein Hsero_2013 [Herbaspirillum seropedicae SmR1]